MPCNNCKLLHASSGTVTKVTRNVLGARGIDRISITENSATTHGHSPSPRMIVSRGGGWGVGYEGHGNCRGVLTKNRTGYGTGNWRTYDVWGSVRSGSATGDPKSRYVASIGHVADDESSLTYMRARYYEPATGRFISEDLSQARLNWYYYCSNDPVNRVDASGNIDWSVVALAAMSAFGAFVANLAANALHPDFKKALLAGVQGFLVGYAVASAANATGRGAYGAFLEWQYAPFVVGGLANASAAWLIAALTSADFGMGDFILAFLCGGIGGMIGSSDSLSDYMDWMLGGVVMSAVSEFGGAVLRSTTVP